MGQQFAKDIPRENNMAEAATGDFSKDDKTDAVPRENVPAATGNAPSTSPAYPVGCGDSLGGRELTLEGLLSMTPVVHGVDVVRQAARDLFLSCVKSQRNVRDVFFPQHMPHALEKKVDSNWFEFDKYACLYVCQVRQTIIALLPCGLHLAQWEGNKVP